MGDGERWQGWVDRLHRDIHCSDAVENKFYEENRPTLISYTSSYIWQNSVRELTGMYFYLLFPGLFGPKEERWIVMMVSSIAQSILQDELHLPIRTNLPTASFYSTRCNIRTFIMMNASGLQILLTKMSSCWIGGSGNPTHPTMQQPPAWLGG